MMLMVSWKFREVWHRATNPGETDLDPSSFGLSHFVEPESEHLPLDAQSQSYRDHQARIE
jgi:hypothetical protein